MSERASYFRIGVFLLLGLVILAAGLIAFGATNAFRPQMEFETYIDGSVQGVDLGSAVKFRGVPVGRVKDISFTFNEYEQSEEKSGYNYVIIIMEVDKELFPGMFSRDISDLLERNIQRGMRVRIEPVGITGMNFLNVDYISDPARFPMLPISWKPRNYYIPSAPGEITSILDSLNSIMHQVEQLNLHGIGENAVELLANLNKAIEDADVAKLSADAQNVMDGGQEALREIKDAVDRLKVILGNLEPVSEIRAADIQVILENIRIASDNLRQLSSDAKRDPAQLLFGAPPKKTRIFDPKPHREKK